MLTAATLTFLFTDIQDSSLLWEEHPESMRRSLTTHNKIVRDAVAGHDGSIVKDRGDGYLAVFGNAASAIAAALQMQRRLIGAEWEEPIGPLQVRLGMHSGTAEPRDGDYFGPDVNRAARLEAAANGGQVLVSEATKVLAQEGLPEEADLRDLGFHTLRGLTRPERLYQLIAPGLPEEFPPVRTVAGGRPAPPTFATSFVGRSAELAVLSERLRDTETRVLTLLGPGGIGKTRLAVETAHQLSPEFTGGVAFADLIRVAEPEGVPLAIAQAFGLHPEGSASAIDMVVSEISNRTLLVLDNFEDLIAASAMIADLVRRCAEVTLLVTSRTPLRIGGEIIHQVEPLGLKSANGAVPAAVDLFIDRARYLGVEIDLDGSDAVAVGSIVRRLDGLPLAIELAAARVRLLSVAELDRRLSQSLAVVGSGGADLPERQRTIEATIDWSVDSLTPEQRTVFYRLAVFPAGATVEQVEHVAAAELNGDGLELVSALVDNSLVSVVSDAAGGKRFRQLTLLRDYAAKRLAEDGDDELTLGRLVDYYADTAEATGWAMEHDGDLLDEAEMDHPNLAAAMRWSLEAGRAGEMVAVLFERWPVWFNGDRVAESAAWIKRAERVLDGSPELEWLKGLFAFQAGDYAMAADQFDLALNGFHEANNPGGVALAKTFAGALADPTHGEAMLREAADYFDAQDRAMSRYVALLFISAKAVELGDLERALEMRWRLLDDVEAIGNDHVTGWTHWNVAIALIGLGRTDEAIEQNTLAFGPMAALNYHEGIASVAEVFAIVDADQGKAERAALIHGACEAVWERLGVRVWWEVVPFIADAMTTARDQLGEVEYKRVIAEGRSLSVDQLVGLVEA